MWVLSLLPLPVFHGTNRSFGRFSTALLGDKTGALDAKSGFFFAENPRAAAEFTWEAGEQFGGNLMPVFLRLSNPLVVSDLLLDGARGTAAGLRMQQARNFVNGVAIDGGNHSLISHIGKQGNFAFFIFRDFTLGTAHQDIRLDTDFTQLFN